MSSSSGDEGSLASKKRKVQRACDQCRRRKRKCDGDGQLDSKCSKCLASGTDCTYLEAATKRDLLKIHVQILEDRLKNVERLLQPHIPGLDLSGDLSELVEFLSARQKTSAAALDPPTVSVASPEPQLRSNLLDEQVGADDNELADRLENMSLDNDPRFFGKSSDTVLIHAAFEVKSALAANRTPSPGGPSLDQGQKQSSRPPHRRTIFWNNRPWETLIATRLTDTYPVAQSVLDTGLPQMHKRTTYSFPPHDLLLSLVELYFEFSNIFMPLLHKPTFLKQLAQGLHLRPTEQGRSFGAHVLLVCAIGSRWSNDPRVRLDFPPDAETVWGDQFEYPWHSSGWKWFNQVELIRRNVLQPPTLADLQFYCLVVIFLLPTSAPQAGWNLLGIALRLAEDVGAHRRKDRIPPAQELTRSQRANQLKEEEEWRRVWWVLVCLDRLLSSTMGRPCAIEDDDFDLELPLDVDDEYWDDPMGEDDLSRMFKQPEGKPSSISFFIQFIKLMKLLAFSLRTIYPVNKSKLLLDLVGEQWEHHLVARIDSGLNKWIDEVPNHLRWCPPYTNRTFLNQSVILHAHFYHNRIIVHRKFVPPSQRPSWWSFPSLAICTNAARSCFRVVDTLRQQLLQEDSDRKQRGEFVEVDGRSMSVHPYYMPAIFSSGVLLLLDMWRRSLAGITNAGMGHQSGKEMEDVYKCLMIMQLCEGRWHSSGRAWDMLAELSDVPSQNPVTSPEPVQYDAEGYGLFADMDEMHSNMATWPAGAASELHPSSLSVPVASTNHRGPNQQHQEPVAMYPHQFSHVPFHHTSTSQDPVDDAASAFFQNLLASGYSDTSYLDATQPMFQSSHLYSGASQWHEAQGDSTGLEWPPASDFRFDTAR